MDERRRDAVEAGEAAEEAGPPCGHDDGWQAGCPWCEAQEAEALRLAERSKPGRHRADG